MKKFKYDINGVRKQFPCLSREVNGYSAAFFDGPGGTQVPQRVADKICDYLFHHNANAHGCFVTSIESDTLLKKARETFADFLGCDWKEISFGANTSSNNFKLSLGIARDLAAGDEVIITDIDHEGNRSPWRLLAERGVVVKSVKVNPETCILDLEDYKSKLSQKTKVVAVNWAANAVGTITDVKTVIKLAHEVGALTVVDAVHYAAHKPIDVKDIDTDFMLCSAYKFFGPHIGVIYGKKEAMDNLRTIRVMADDNTEAPEKFETGTPNFECICGAAEAVEFISDIGKLYVDCFEDRLKGLEGRRKNIVAGMIAIDEYEEPLASKLRKELRKIEKVTVYGPPEGHPRTTTVSFTIEGKRPLEVAQYLADKGIFVWDGDFYAVETINTVLKLKEKGGLVRIGLAPYNTEEEVDRTIEAIKEICSF